MKYRKQKSYLYFFYINYLKNLNYSSRIQNGNSCNFVFNYFYNLKRFKLSFKYPKQKQ